MSDPIAVTGEIEFQDNFPYKSYSAYLNTAYGNSYKKIKTFNYLGSLLTNQDFIYEVKCRHNAGNSCHYSVQTFLSSQLLCKKLTI